MTIIHNPILRGFNPDASAIRVGDDYYIATSTFEWFPGVLIHHSRDLVHWRSLTRPLDRLSLLDLRGLPSSGGIWAPSFSYDNGIYYLCFTNVVGRRGVYKDLHNYVVTATSIEGPWSEPIYLNSSGFDHFLFHDTDGRKWLFNMQWDFRKNKSRFAGIIMQEYSPEQRRLVGPIKTVTSGTSLGVTEGPMVYYKNGYYYLLVAEGGTGANHAATLLRARSVEGPYETDPDYPVLTSVGHPDHPLQKAGHGSLVETQHGDWYMVHICSRTLPDGSGLSPLGRETSIQKVVWTGDGWLRLASGSRLPELTVQAPEPAAASVPSRAGDRPFHRAGAGNCMAYAACAGRSVLAELERAARASSLVRPGIAVLLELSVAGRKTAAELLLRGGDLRGIRAGVLHSDGRSCTLL
ncbi:Beta-xylosidase [compost metagenome]